jgi:hypothetical protein
MNYLFLAIRSLRPDAEFSFTEQDYSTVIWTKLEGNPPTQTQIDAAIEEVKANKIAAEAMVATQKQALLAKLGITADEARLLLS